MSQNAEALAHYYHLRAQGLDPDVARQHVRQRFGVEISDQVPSADAVVTPVPPRESMEFGGEFCQTVWGSSTGPQYGREPVEFCENGCCRLGAVVRSCRRDWHSSLDMD